MNEQLKVTVLWDDHYDAIVEIDFGEGEPVLIGTMQFVGDKLSDALHEQFTELLVAAQAQFRLPDANYTQEVTGTRVDLPLNVGYIIEVHD